MKYIFIFLLFLACKYADHQGHTSDVILKATTNESHQTNTLTRIEPPKDYFRLGLKEDSFQDYLRSLKLKPKGSKVKYYNGNIKPNLNIYTDVIDLEIGNKNLHQCADAIMRLRAEYLWKQKMFDKIHFNFTNGFRVDYIEWMKGKRVKVKGNISSWYDATGPSNTYEDFWEYMETIFMYAGTASLEKELEQISSVNADIGDVLIQGGHPGHAVIILDKAIHNETKMPVFLLGQSYMPAQEIQILANTTYSTISPWYDLDHEVIETPEWTFTRENLKRFRP